MSEQLKRGERIPGSKYFRDYCQCGEPLRVTEQRIGTDEACEDCAGKGNGVGNAVTMFDPDAHKVADSEWYVDSSSDSSGELGAS